MSRGLGDVYKRQVHELIPECQRNQEKAPYSATMGIILGFAVMMLLDVMLG